MTKQAPLTVNYFCYGSNLLTDRIRVRLKGAQKISKAVLNDFKLTFSGYSDLWKGPTANIVPNKESQVIGIVWSITYKDLENLDLQEKGYRILAITVNCNGDNIECITYVQTNEEIKRGQEILASEDCIPSNVYKEVIVKGAIEHNLPESYINILKSFKCKCIQDCELGHLIK